MITRSERSLQLRTGGGEALLHVGFALHGVRLPPCRLGQRALLLFRL